MEETKKLSFIKAFIFGVFSIAIYSVVDEIVWQSLYFFLSEETYYNVSYYIVDTVVCGICIIIYMLFFILLKNILKVDEFFIKKNISNKLLFIVATVVLALGMSGVTTQWLYFVYKYLEDVPFFKQSIASYDESWSGIEEESYFFVFMSVVFLGPIVEELMFRGILFNILSKKFNLIIGAILSGLVFGIWHMELIQSIYTALFGIVLAILYAKSGSLLFPILCHIVYNFVGTLPPDLSTDFVIEAVDVLNAICIIPSLFIVYKLFTIKEIKNMENLDGIDRGEV